ncbi:MAG: hypothetical protein JO141_12525 [Bradyrhizobium sp.]|nr:hypothetical protein [Bradyrhizobium sp.]
MLAVIDLIDPLPPNVGLSSSHLLADNRAMTITVEHDSRVPTSLKLRRAIATPLYALALLLSFVTDGIARQESLRVRISTSRTSSHRMCLQSS